MAAVKKKYRSKACIHLEITMRFLSGNYTFFIQVRLNLMNRVSKPLR
jgi:hypothetical protein